MIGFNNGVYQELVEINVPITSVSINRGYGAFEFFEVINRKPFYGQRHFDRFNRSLEILKLNPEYQNSFFQIIEELVSRNNLENTYIKIFALLHQKNESDFYNAVLYAFPTQMPQYDVSIYQHGASLITKKFQRFLPEAKSTNYLAGQYWSDEQTDSRVVDVVYHNGETVQETSRGNIFIVKKDVVLTPERNLLKGITRSIVLDILAERNIPHQVKDVSLDALLSADEVFLTSTTKLIVPITVIDNVPVGNGLPGSITQKMMMEFQKIKNEFKKEN